MLETYFRPTVQPIFTYFALRIGPFIHPNTLTLLGFISGIGAGLCIALSQFLLAGIVLLVSGACDILDGTLARVTKQTSTIGAYSDLITDRMVEAAVIIGFAIALPENGLAYILFLSAVLLHFSTFLAAGALFKNTGPKSMYYDASLVERAEAFVIFFIMLASPGYAYQMLMCFNGLVFCSGMARYIRIIRKQQNSTITNA